MSSISKLVYYKNPCYHQKCHSPPEAWRALSFPKLRNASVKVLCKKRASTFSDHLAVSSWRKSPGPLPLIWSMDYKIKRMKRSKPLLFATHSLHNFLWTPLEPLTDASFRNRGSLYVAMIPLFWLNPQVASCWFQNPSPLGSLGVVKTPLITEYHSFLRHHLLTIFRQFLSSLAPSNLILHSLWPLEKKRPSSEAPMKSIHAKLRNAPTSLHTFFPSVNFMKYYGNLHNPVFCEYPTPFLDFRSSPMLFGNVLMQSWKPFPNKRSVLELCCGHLRKWVSRWRS